LPGRLETGVATFVGALLDLVAPAACVACGAVPDGAEFCDRGPRVGGLRPWDEASLCRACARLIGPPVSARLERPGGGQLPVSAAGATGPVVARIIHAWKYHGLRGLAWPLAARIPCPAGAGAPGAGPVLVPVPLHGRRRRRRGFNQAHMLACLIGRSSGLPTDPEVLRRRRSTDQQARLDDGPARRRNVDGAFEATAAPPDPPALLLVDDVVTSGATILAVAAAAVAGGWPVAGVLAVATSLPSLRPVDTRGAGF